MCLQGGTVWKMGLSAWGAYLADLALGTNKADNGEASVALHPARAGPCLHGLYNDCHTIMLAYFCPHLQQSHLLSQGWPASLSALFSL